MLHNQNFSSLLEMFFEKSNEPKFSYFPEEDDHMMDYNESLLKALNNFFNSI